MFELNFAGNTWPVSWVMPLVRGISPALCCPTIVIRLHCILICVFEVSDTKIYLVMITGDISESVNYKS